MALRIVGIIVVPRNRRPGSALAWLLAIMVFPIIGFPLYLLLGKAELLRKRRAKQAVVNRLMRVRAQGIPDSELDEDVPSWLQSDRKSTRLNSSHVAISYAVFCLKKKKKQLMKENK